MYVCQCSCAILILSEISDVVLSVAEPHLHQILQKMVESKQWEKLKALVDHGKASGKGPGFFASGFSIAIVIDTDFPSSDKEKAS